MKFMGSKRWLFQILLFAILLASGAPSSMIPSGIAQPTSAYFYRFNVDREGFTTVEIDFSSAEISGESWVFVPRNESSWHLTVTPPGQIQWREIVETDQVIEQNLYFYRALKFGYHSNGVFNMTIGFDFDNGALILEPRGIFYSPQIGFEASSDGNAEVLFDHNFQIKQDLAVVVGSSATYPAQKVESDRVLFKLQENVVRLQVELGINVASEVTTLRSSDNRTFRFQTEMRYKPYAASVLRFYDRIYNQTTRLFNVTLDNVVVQWFLPDFESLLSVGGFVPLLTGERLGEININIVYIRTVNGTVEDIAAHELVHRFLGNAGISPNEFLWFYEGMAQYISVNIVLNLGYEGAETEKDNLENSATSLIEFLGGEHFNSTGLQRWSPSYRPSNVSEGLLYVASYYVISRLPQVVQRDGFEYYQGFFELVGQLSSGFDGVKVKGIGELALYLSQAANASVALTLKRWGFTVADLYESPVKDLIIEAGKAVGVLNPVFQPYRFLAECLYQQALSSAEMGDWNRAQCLLQLSISLANLAPLLALVTIAALLAFFGYVLARRSRRQLRPVPPPPPEIMQPSI